MIQMIRRWVLLASIGEDGSALARGTGARC